MTEQLLDEVIEEEKTKSGIFTRKSLLIPALSTILLLSGCDAPAETPETLKDGKPSLAIAGETRGPEPGNELSALAHRLDPRNKDTLKNLLKGTGPKPPKPWDDGMVLMKSPKRVERIGSPVEDAETRVRLWHPRSLGNAYFGAEVEMGPIKSPYRSKLNRVWFALGVRNATVDKNDVSIEVMDKDRKEYREVDLGKLHRIEAGRRLSPSSTVIENFIINSVIAIPRYGAMLKTALTAGDIERTALYDHIMQDTQEHLQKFLEARRYALMVRATRGNMRGIEVHRGPLPLTYHIYMAAPGTETWTKARFKIKASLKPAYSTNEEDFFYGVIHTNFLTNIKDINKFKKALMPGSKLQK